MSGGPPGGAGNQSNVSVFQHGGRLLSSGEIGLPYELSPDDLRTIGVHDFDGALTTGRLWSERQAAAESRVGQFKIPGNQ